MWWIHHNGRNYCIFKYNSVLYNSYNWEDLEGFWYLLPILSTQSKMYTFTADCLVDDPLFWDEQNYYFITPEKYLIDFKIPAADIDFINKCFYKIIDNDSSKI